VGTSSKCGGWIVHISLFLYRVEGEGNASILDVVVSRNQSTPFAKAKPGPDPLESRLDECKKALESARESRTMLSNYVTSIGAATVDISKLDAIIDTYGVLTSKADARVTDLENEVDRIENEMTSGSGVQSLGSVDRQGWEAVVLLEGQVDEEVVLNVSYGERLFPLIL